ncbi:hypothetical protein ABE26_24975 [Cytobacillus firmus]|nr:hypothetical protein [Cytobacillus firmus]
MIHYYKFSIGGCSSYAGWWGVFMPIKITMISLILRQHIIGIGILVLLEEILGHLIKKLLRVDGIK